MSNDIKNLANAIKKDAGLGNSIVIGEATYTVELLPAKQAFVIATELFKVVAPALGSWADHQKNDGLLLPEEQNLFTEMAVLLTRQLDNLGVADILDVLTNKVYKDGTLVDVDKEFRGNVGGLFALVEFSLKANIGPLFTGWLAAKGLSLPSLPSQTNSLEDTSSK